MLITMFPLPFNFIRAIEEPDEEQLRNARFLVGTMMTASHAHLGERLINSCQSFSLPIALFEIPTVHCSISPMGSEDLSYTKANFIHFLLERYSKPVVYIDVDCEILKYPERIDALLNDHVDFAIFNWLAEEDTASFKPVEVVLKEAGGARVIRDRFFKFSHAFNFYSTSQLVCSGAVQFYNITPAAKILLTAWHEIIESSPHSADDHCLDFAFNNREANIKDISFAWLDKSYARYAWWIYTEPVINHPDFPASGHQTVSIDQRGWKKRVYLNLTEQQATPMVFPCDCLIDTLEKTLVHIQDGQLVQYAAFSTKLYL